MILVTGGLGFIGLHTARSLLQRNETCVLTRFNVARDPDFLQGEVGKRVFVEQLDVTDETAFLALGERYEIDGIIHLAVPGIAALGPFEDFATNMSGLSNALRAASEWGVKRISLASSISVYQGVSGPRFREDLPLPLSAANPTEAFKKAFEILAGHLAKRAEIECVSLRIAYIYGPLYHSMVNLPSRLVHAAVQGRAPEYPRGMPFADDGGDLFYVRDCGEAIATLQTAERLAHSVYNVGRGKTTTNQDLVTAIQQVIPDAELPLAAGFDPHGPGVATCLETSWLEEDTGFVPSYSTESAIADYVSWLQMGNAE